MGFSPEAVVPTGVVDSWGVKVDDVRPETVVLLDAVDFWLTVLGSSAEAVVAVDVVYSP